jgi:hypothetical protein
VQLLELLNNICECDASAIRRLEGTDGVQLLLSLLADAEIRGAVLRLVHTVTEDASIFVGQLRAAGGGVTLWNIANSSEEHIVARLHAVGALTNIAETDEERDQASSMAVPLVVMGLKFDPASLAEASRAMKDLTSSPQELELAAASPSSASAPEVPPGGGGGEGALKRGTTDLLRDDEKEEDDVRQQWKFANIDPIRLAAETLANLCFRSDDDDVDEEYDSDENNVMEDGDEGAAADPNEAMNSCVLRALVDAGVLQGALHALTGLLAPHEEPVPWGVRSDLNAAAETVSVACANLVQAVPTPLLKSILCSTTVWSSMCALISAQRSSGQVACLETTTSIIWALARRAGTWLAANPPEALLGMLPLSLICDPASSATPPARVNAVGAVAALACALPSSSGGPTDILLAALDDSSLLVVAESLNGIMDAYGDDDRDDAYKAKGIQGKLVSLLPNFRAKVRSESKAFRREEIHHLRETASNTARFIDYKKSAL